MTTLRSVVARLASVVRCAGIVYIAVQVVVWHSFYTADSWRLAGPVAAMAWAAAVAAYLWRRWPGPLFACLDAAVYVVLALTAQGGVPPAIRDDPFSWLVISMSSQLIVPAWYAPAALSMPLALASPLTYWVGVAQMPGTSNRMVMAAAILLIMAASVHVYGRRELYGRAAAADAALAEADRAASEQYVILSRNIERREHERLLHDTALNTLTALARAGPGDVAAVVSWCRRDVALIEGALTDPGAPDAGAKRALGDLAGGVQAVAAEMRARGLTVHLEIVGDAAAAVPARVVTAILNAAREALSNVARHAGTGEAWVEVSLSAGDGNGETPGRMRVTVRDRGAGFDFARVDQARLGVRRSIAERAADCGGQASIWSAPGQGTQVCLSWPAPARARPGRAGRSRARPGGPAVVSHHEVVRHTTEFGLRRMTGVVAAILPFAALIHVLANLGDYRQPAVAVAVWLAMFPAAVWLVPRIRSGGLSRGEAAAAVLIALAAVAVIGWEHHAHDSSGSVDLAILGTVWLLALVAMSRPAWAWVPGALVIFAVHALLLVRDVGASPLNLAQLEAAGYILVVVLVVFAALRPTLAMHISMAARRASLASESVTKRAAAAAVLQDRQHRLARLEVEALPLLRGIADGTLDPTARDVRERCARHAAVLRHSLTGRAPGTAGLVVGLRAHPAGRERAGTAGKPPGHRRPGKPGAGRRRSGPGHGGRRDQRASGPPGHADGSRVRRRRGAVPDLQRAAPRHPRSGAIRA